MAVIAIALCTVLVLLHQLHPVQTTVCNLPHMQATAMCRGHNKVNRTVTPVETSTGVVTMKDYELDEVLSQVTEDEHMDLGSAYDREDLGFAPDVNVNMSVADVATDQQNVSELHLSQDSEVTYVHSVKVNVTEQQDQSGVVD